jgi:hypothetical protein
MHLDIIRLRWKLFGHILRLDEDVPAQRTMRTYFENPDQLPKRPTRGPNNLPQQLSKDLTLVGRQLKSFDDFLELYDMAQNRREWQRLTNRILAKKRKLADQNLKDMEVRSRDSRKRKRMLERRVAIQDQDEDEQNGRKRPRIVLTWNTPPPPSPLVIRIRKRRTQEAALVDINAILRTPPNLRRPLAEAPDTGDSFVDRWTNANYVFM